MVHHVASDWTQVRIEGRDGTVVLGAETADTIRRQLYAATKPAALTAEPRWVVSLSEQHGSIFVQAAGDGGRFLLEDGAGAVIASLTVSSEELLDWRGQLCAWRAPAALTLDGEVAQVLPTAPRPYVEELIHNVRPALNAPDAVFYGVRANRSDSATSTFGGYAFCKRLRRMRGGDGRSVELRPGEFVFCVYATSEGVVYDWAWARASTSNAKRPVHWKRRFRKQLRRPVSAVLDNVPPLEDVAHGQRRPGWHISSADCLVSFSDATPYFAEWLNDDLTVFLSWPWGRPIGVKLKNVRHHVAKLAAEPSVELGGEGHGVTVSMLIQKTLPREVIDVPQPGIPMQPVRREDIAALSDWTVPEELVSQRSAYQTTA